MLKIKDSNFDDETVAETGSTNFFFVLTGSCPGQWPVMWLFNEFLMMRNVLSFHCRHRSRKNLPKGIWNGGYEVSVTYMILHQRTKKIEPPANPTTPKLDPKPFVSSRWNGKRECARMLLSGELLWNVRERVPRLGGLGAVAGLSFGTTLHRPVFDMLRFTRQVPFWPINRFIG
jgi:hypothetical protein